MVPSRKTLGLGLRSIRQRGVSSGVPNQRWGHAPRLVAGIALPSVYLAYEQAVRAYAYMLLGSAATEQLFMQQLEGTVELELSLRPFSPVGELRGLLSPIVEEPRTPGPVRHRAFTLLEPAKVSKSTYNRHRRAAEQQPPPVAMMRYVSLLRPMHLSALFASQAQEMRLYCRKSRAQTEYFAELPAGWGGWTASSS